MALHPGSSVVYGLVSDLCCNAWHCLVLERLDTTDGYIYMAHGYFPCLHTVSISLDILLISIDNTFVTDWQSALKF